MDSSNSFVYSQSTEQHCYSELCSLTPRHVMNSGYERDLSQAEKCCNKQVQFDSKIRLQRLGRG